MALKSLDLKVGIALSHSEMRISDHAEAAAAVSEDY